MSPSIFPSNIPPPISPRTIPPGQYPLGQHRPWTISPSTISPQDDIARQYPLDNIPRKYPRQYPPGSRTPPPIYQGGGVLAGGYCPGDIARGALSWGYSRGGGGYCPGGYCPGDIVQGILSGGILLGDIVRRILTWDIALLPAAMPGRLFQVYTTGYKISSNSWSSLALCLNIIGSLYHPTVLCTCTLNILLEYIPPESLLQSGESMFCCMPNMLVFFHFFFFGGGATKISSYNFENIILCKMPVDPKTRWIVLCSLKL